MQTLSDFLESGESIEDFLIVYSYIPRCQILAFLELSRDITIDQSACASLDRLVEQHSRFGIERPSRISALARRLNGRRIGLV